MKKEDLFRAKKMEMFVKHFRTLEIDNGMALYPSIFVTILWHKGEVRAYMNYMVLGTVKDSEQSFEHIMENYTKLMANAQAFVKEMNASLYHY